MKDNDGDDLMYQHASFIDYISDVEKITGFTRFQAEGFWFDNGKAYKDDIKIYEFHVANKDATEVYEMLWHHARELCRTMKQECIYLQHNNETHLVR